MKNKKKTKSNEIFRLDVESVERWTSEAGWENRKLIKKWANKKRQLVDAEAEVKTAKAKIMGAVQERREGGVKITDKTALAMIDLDEDVIDARFARDNLQVDIDECYQTLLLFRDMWSAVPTLRSHNNMLMKSEMDI